MDISATKKRQKQRKSFLAVSVAETTFYGKMVNYKVVELPDTRQTLFLISRYVFHSARYGRRKNGENVVSAVSARFRHRNGALSKNR